MVSKIMRTMLVSLAVLLLGIVLATPPAAQAAAIQSGGWWGEYFNNTTLSGTPALVRNDARIDFDWGGGSPGPGVGGDYFSVRWRGTIDVSSGRYRFTTYSDDGVRLWVNGRLLIDKWFDQQAAYHLAEIDLTSGAATVQFEYYEGTGGAAVRLHYDRLDGSSGGGSGAWRAEYYKGRSLSGSAALVRQEADVNFGWGSGSPAASLLGTDSFSARFTRHVDLPAGRYRFTVTADDGVRLWVNNQLIIDQWRDQDGVTHQAEINLPGGSVPIRVEYYENTGGAQLRLTWAWVAGYGGAPAPGDWWAEYFNNTSLSGTPVVVRTEGQPAYNWGLGSPAPGIIGNDNFSARWTRTMEFVPGRYRFTVTTDDGVRLWVNNVLLINNWRNQGARPVSAEIDLSGGPVSLRMEYYEADVLAEARLDWIRVSAPGNSGGPTVPGAPTATVGSYRLNVRQGPGVGHAVITTLNRGTTVSLAGFRNADASWVMVVLPNGTRGWSYAGLLQSNYPFGSLTVWTGEGGPTTPPSSSNTATVKAFRLNVRYGPGVNYTIMTTVSRGTTLQLLGRNASATWVKVVVPSGAQGWVNASYLNMPVSTASLPLSG